MSQLCARIVVSKLSPLWGGRWQTPFVPRSCSFCSTACHLVTLLSNTNNQDLRCHVCRPPNVQPSSQPWTYRRPHQHGRLWPCLHISILSNILPGRLQSVHLLWILFSASWAQQVCHGVLGLQLFVLCLGNCPQTGSGGNSVACFVSYASFWNCSLVLSVACCLKQLSHIFCSVLYLFTGRSLVQYNYFIMDGHFL